MHWDPGSFSENSEQETIYSDPSYYQQDTPEAPRSAQPVQHLQSYSDYMHGPTVVNIYDPSFAQEYH